MFTKLFSAIKMKVLYMVYLTCYFDHFCSSIAHDLMTTVTIWVGTNTGNVVAMGIQVKPTKDHPRTIELCPNGNVCVCVSVCCSVCVCA